MNQEHGFSKIRHGFVGKIWIGLVIVGVLVGAGFGYWMFTQQKAQETAAKAASKYSTSPVKKGNISVAVSGSGTLITNQLVDLEFSASGTVGELDVQVGDQVTRGQVLAKLAGSHDLEIAVQTQQLALDTAQKALDDLTANAAINLAQARVDQLTAAEALQTAQDHLLTQRSPTCQAGQTQDYYTAYRFDETEVARLKGILETAKGIEKNVTAADLNKRQKLYETDYANYLYCTNGPTKQLIATSQSNLQLAKAKLDLANSKLETLQANNGVDPIEQTAAQAALKSSQQAVVKAQEVLAGATITAPMDGTVSVVNGVVGDFVTVVDENSASDAVNTGTFITLLDLSHPQVQVNIDETDLQNFAVGCAADVSFESLPSQKYTATVTQVSPTMVTVQSVAMVQGLVDLEKKQTAAGKSFPIGLTASVDVTCSQAQDVLLAPAQALYQSSGENPYVYVLNAQGQPERRTVEVGLKTVALMEIRSGLKEGDLVITSEIQGS